jgi:hypothetical protein
VIISSCQAVELATGAGTMAGVIFAVAIALGTIACVGIVIWASDY